MASTQAALGAEEVIPLTWNRRITRRAVAVAAAVLALTIAVAGCGSRQAPAGPPAAGSPAPPAGDRAQAAALARQLLGELVFPPGTQPARPSPLPSALRNPWAGPAGASAPGSVDLGRIDGVSLDPAAAQAFLLAHAPSAASLTGTGYQTGPGGITGRDLYFHLSSLPRGIDDAEVVQLIVPHGNVSALLATYVHVIWFPSRTAAEHIDPAAFAAVSIHAVFLNRKPHNVTRSFGSPASVASVAALLNGLAASPPTMTSCPSGVATFTVTFQPRTIRQPGVAVTTYGCAGAAVSVGGIPQPGLLDPRNAVAATAARLLRVSVTDT